MVEQGIPEVTGGRARILVWLMHKAFIVTRGMTMGVRAACFDEEGRIFLVRHTYVPGWYMPGGGMERGETALQTLHKELREEGNLEVLGVPELFHVYLNRNASKRDHVLFYKVNVNQTAPRAADYEIAESGFFALDALPPEVTQATARRLQELSGKIEKGEYW